MKKLISVFLIFFLLCGCTAASDGQNADSHAAVTVNLPKDDTVNGYRTGEYESASSGMPDTSHAQDAQPASEPEASEKEASAVSEVSAEYIGNSSSHIFHKSDCSSAKNMKEENKVAFSSRAEAIGNGYAPCKRCSP